MKFAVIVSLLWIVLGNCCFGQPNDLRFNHLTTNDGLSDDYVICLLQDHEGLIWIGTRDGLNTYDGNSFKIYKNDARDSATLSDNVIQDLLEDKNHIMWVGTSIGLNQFEKTTGKFRRFINRPNDTNSLSNNNVTSLVENDDGNLFVGTMGGLNIYLKKEGRFIHYMHNDHDNGSISNNSIYKIYKDREGSIWIFTAYGLNRFDLKSKRFINENEINGQNHIRFTNYSGSIFEDSRNHLWYATESGLYLINRDVKNKIGYERGLPNQKIDQVREISEDHQHNVWFASRTGLIRYNLNSKIISTFVHDPIFEYSLTKNDICSLLTDKQGILWIGTYEGGLNILYNINNSIELYRNNPLKNNSLTNNFVLNFLEDADKEIWVGTDQGGLNLFDKFNHTFKSYTVENSNICSNTILSLMQDRNGIIWIGTWNNGICSFNKKTRFFTSYQANEQKMGKLNNPNVWTMLEDRNGSFWIGTMGGGLNRLDRKTGLFSHYMYDAVSPDSSYTSDNEVWALLQDTKGNLWVGSSKALNLFNPTTGHFKHFYRKSLIDNTSHEFNMLCIFEDRKGRIWIGSESEGLCKLVGNYVTNDPVKEKVPASEVCGIKEDDHGNLWLSTNKGMYKYNPDLNQSANFDRSYGWQGNQFSQGASLKSSQGLLYFGGPNGFNVFHPDSLINNSFNAPVILTDFLIFNKPVPVGTKSRLKKQINQSDTIFLSYKQSVFTIQFACLNYINPKKNQFAYILEGFDPSWNYVGSKNEVTYTNLDPGTYLFKVKAANNDGVWGTCIKTITIRIEPPFWKTVWFRFLSIALLLGIIYGTYRQRVHNIKTKNELLEKIVQQRTLELEQRAREIEDKNLLLLNQAKSLNEINTLLEENQQHIEEQTEELKSQKEDLLVQQEQLTQLNVTKDKLFSIIAHDLRNPFQAILGFSEILMKDFERLSREKIDKYLEIINTSSRRSNELLNNLLLWSITQTGRITYEPEILNMFEIATESINLLETIALQKNITVNLLIDPSCTCYADPNMLQTIFRNLLSNALKFTFTDGTIIIDAKPGNQMVEISLSDDGVGMSEENIQKLFSIDKQILTQGTQLEPGTGLGLFLCKEFVERNNGKIWVTSELNKGTTFYFTIPMNNY